MGKANLWNDLSRHVVSINIPLQLDIHRIDTLEVHYSNFEWQLQGSQIKFGPYSHFFHHFWQFFCSLLVTPSSLKCPCAPLKVFMSKCFLPIYCFCLLLIVFSFLCFSIASSRCLCYLFKRTASPFRCTFLSCLLLISFQHKLAFPFFLFSKFSFFSLFLCGPPYQ